MSTALDAPDLAISLQLDSYAPRAARFYVSQVDRPSPDLRDAVMLLTSELVTRALQCEGATGRSVALRVWMTPDVVRVELRAPRELLLGPRAPEGPRYELVLLDKLADRWSLEPEEEEPRTWFEIDRHDVPARSGG
jgi:hypothetical protein